jgi:hypothetical protein
MRPKKASFRGVLRPLKRFFWKNEKKFAKIFAK